ncbi:MAG: acyltransferase [Flavobacteriaceae bacterium]|nr:acyltransferase [Bacteroidia bacterium]MBT8286653.1 acyltransferase [Bacteroidia bacterium]NNF75178.1 acyltransferase [Flavobacteriaceae bacterium]NNK72449.1 acyltransferase [Flavobacteriaceae bacterium]
MNVFLLLFRIRKRLRRLWASWWFKTINKYFVKTGRSVNIGNRVSVVPILSDNFSLNIFLDDNSYVRDDVVFQGAGKVYLGKRSYIGSFSVIGANESVHIGCDVMIADGVSIRDTDHEFANLEEPMITQGITTAPVRIEDNVWIGYGAVITKGVTIGSGSIIAANAVVTKSFGPNSIVGGVPAKLIRNRHD